MPVPLLSGSTSRPGRNFMLCGLGVVSVSMNRLRRPAPAPSRATHRLPITLRSSILAATQHCQPSHLQWCRVIAHFFGAVLSK